MTFSDHRELQMRLIFKLLLSGLLLTFLSSSFADPQRYQVELLIFSHINAQGVNSEHWPVIKDPTINLSRALALNPLLENDAQNPNQIASYQILPNFNFSLAKSDRKLMNTQGYNVIMHIAWQQELAGPHDAKWVHLFGGAGYDNEGNVIAQDMDGSATYDQAQHWQVDGLIRLDTVRYINTRYNLYFAAPTGEIQDLSNNDNFAEIDTPLIYFKLDQFRRMRSDELNYIGHPLYGILIKVTKVDQTADTNDTSQG